MRAQPPRRLQERNDKYIYKSVASLVQYFSKDILSLQWPLSNKKRQAFCHTNNQNNSHNCHDKTLPPLSTIRGT